MALLYRVTACAYAATAHDLHWIPIMRCYIAFLTYSHARLPIEQA